VNGRPIGADPVKKEYDINAAFRTEWPRGQNTVSMKVMRNGAEADVAFAHGTIRLHPTQLYESISMLLVFLLLLAYYPLRSQPGAVMVLFMYCYGIHRFLNEMLRTDTDPVVFGLTLSQTVSILVIGAATILAILLRIKKLHTPPSEFAPA